MKPCEITCTNNAHNGTSEVNEFGAFKIHNFIHMFSLFLFYYYVWSSSVSSWHFPHLSSHYFFFRNGLCFYICVVGCTSATRTRSVSCRYTLKCSWSDAPPPPRIGIASNKFWQRNGDGNGAASVRQQRPLLPQPKQQIYELSIRPRVRLTTA